MSNSLWPHGLQHTRLPSPSPTPRACLNSYPSSRWCHLTISSSDLPFSCLQSFPASGSFPMSQLFRVKWPKYWSFSFSISPSNKYLRLISFRMDCLDLLAVQRTLKSLLHCHSSNMLMEKSREIAPEGMKRLSQSRKKLWMCQVVEVKSSAVKNKIA